MSKRRVRYWWLGGVLMVILIPLFLLMIDEAQAAWVYRDSSAIDPVAACQDGIYIGVGHDGSLVGENINVTITRQSDGQVIASEDFVPPPSNIPGVPYADYYYMFWDAPYQPMPVGAQIVTDGVPTLTIGDCLINPEDSESSTAFTYQGRLDDGGQPANGVYDFRFRLYNDASSGSQVGPAVWQEDVTVADGLFTLELDFGGEAFDGHARWLQIGVRPGADTGSPTILNPRQALTAVPIAHTLRPGATISGTLPDQSILRLKNNIGDALQIDRGYYGLHIQSAAEAAVRIETSDRDGIVMGAWSGSGDDLIAGTGISIRNPGGSGVYVYSSGTDGIVVDSPESSGMSVYDSTLNGYEVYYAGENGVQVYSANEDGMVVSSAGNDGIHVISASDDGLQLGSNPNYPNYGLYIPSPGVPVYGLWPNTANASGEWALYTVDNIQAGNVVAQTFSLVAQVTGPDALTPGDIVAVTGTADPLPGATSPLPLVRLADGRQFTGVIGVVATRMVYEVAPGKEADGEMSLQSATGPAQAGDYVSLIIYGVAQVKVDAGATIAAGDRLTAADSAGQVRALQTREIEGMVVTEGAQVMGIALVTPMAGQKTIPVFVTLR